MKLSIQTSGAALDLLEADARAPENRIREHPIWAAALDGSLPKARLKRLLLAIAPAVAGPGRYAFAAKVSQISPQDGKEQFLALHDALKKPEANADAGWAKVLAAVGANERDIEAAFADPSAEARDFVDVVRVHGLRSGAVEASVIAYMVERHLPKLWGLLADSLEKNYGAPRTALAYLRFEAARADKIDKWVKHLVDTYVVPADTYRVFEGRRAAREAVWAWTVLTETA